MALAIRTWAQTEAARYLGPIASGLFIALAGAATWAALARLNAIIRPDLPWAASVMAVTLVVLVSWLAGIGPPKESAAARRDLLRLWPARDFERSGDGPSIATIVLLIAALTVAWIGIGLFTPVPDLSEYPTTTYRWSLFLMSPVVAGVIEEAAFRGYMQRGLERIDPRNAIWITSLAFVASHVTHGLDAAILLGPGIFIVSMLYGHLAVRTGSIVPGAFIHITGDLAYMYFGVLHGNPSLLFVR